MKYSIAQIREELIRRTGICAHKLDTGIINEDEWKAIMKAANRMITDEKRGCAINANPHIR